MNKIGRYRVLDLLGSGTQGEVYHCRDPQLQRDVAIKLLSKPLLRKADSAQALQEMARAMSQVQHPNVVSVFDIGTQDGRPYVVFEYIQGRTLENLLREQPPNESIALQMLEGILQGMAQAHHQRVAHGHLKASKIMLTPEGMPKITDFAITRVLAESGAAVSDHYSETQADVLALGHLAYLLLCGRAKEPARVEQRNADIEQLDSRFAEWLQRALEPDPNLRFQQAGAMLDALRSLRDHDEPEISGDAHATVQFLLRRIRLKSDLPALAQSIGTLNQLSHAQAHDSNKLAAIITKDHGLTQKILKVANSAYYAAFSGNISTISRAVVILGVNGIRAIAASLALLDHFGKKPEMAPLRDLLSESLFASLSARSVSQYVAPNLAEEAMLGTMLRRLGQILVTYYLPDEAQEISRLIEQERLESDAAERRVLGTRFQEIGRYIAKEWHFPQDIRQCMREPAQLPKTREHDRTVQLQLLASLGEQSTRILRGKKSTEAKQRLERLLKQYGEALGVPHERLIQSLSSAKSEYLSFQTSFANQQTKQAFVDSLDMDSPPEPDTRQQTAAEKLHAGLQSLQNKVKDGISAQGLLDDAVEVLHTSMHFSHVVAALWSPQHKALIGTTAMGEHGRRLADHFRLKVDTSADLLSLAMRQRNDLYIKDATLPQIEKKLPSWLLEQSHPGAFFVLPMWSAEHRVGLIYAEYDLPHGFDEDPQTLRALRALREALSHALHAAAQRSPAQRLSS